MDEDGMNSGMSGQEPGASGVSAHVERELALRLIASRALVDPAFYEELRRDPRAAAQQLHVSLAEEDVARLEGVDWAYLDEHVRELRRGLGLEQVARGAW